MTQIVNMDGCQCVCDTATFVIEETTKINASPLEIGLIVFMIVLIIIGLIMGFNKLNQRNDDDDDDEPRDTYY